MRRINADLTLKNSLKFVHSCLNNIVKNDYSEKETKIVKTEELEEPEDCFGGIIKKGQFGWLARGPLFEVFSLKTGLKISSFRFDLNLGFERCIVTCTAELEVPELNCCILAICMQFSDGPGGVVAICSVQELSKILQCIVIKEKVTSCHFIPKNITKRTILQIFDGCLALGTDNGGIIFLDLNLTKCREALLLAENDEDNIELIPCNLTSDFSDFHYLKKKCQHFKQKNVYFGIELNLDMHEDPSLVLSILSVINILSLAIGLEDGRLILLDLFDFQISCVVNPPSAFKQSPLVKLACVEPADDPRACIYIWALHEGIEPPSALMYSVMYEKKLIEDDGTCLFETFQSCNLRLTLNLSQHGGIPIACHSILKQTAGDEENTISLCLLAWKCQNTTDLLLFDMNQWYKEQMPYTGNAIEDESYLASFTVKDCNALDVYIDPCNVIPFNSIRRLEEHFYPISLSFDCVFLQQNGFTHLYWSGLQNRALEFLKSGGPLAILEPTPYLVEIMRASLLPQYVQRNYSLRRVSSVVETNQFSNRANDSLDYEKNCKSLFSINDQRNILLTVALENNYFGLLKECAVCWADGSHLGTKPNEGLSLSTLTDWIWKCAENIKKRCNSLCIQLFDHCELKTDQRSKTELSNLSRQLKLLANLLDIILTKCREYIPPEAFETLTSQKNSIQMASDYQEVVQWLLNVGLLPEGRPILSDNDEIRPWSRSILVPYPYKALKEFYSAKRKRFAQINKSLVCNRTGSCRILYIDAFIEHECNANVLRDHWIECGGNGLYPPPSLQALLRTLLVPDIPIENKYILFIYLFLDLNMAVECKNHSAIVHNLIKFPAVFKMNASVIKTVQAFWSLDHGQFELAIEELISPFSQGRKLLQWQKELLIEALLVQDQPNLALRAVQAPGTPISSLLELKTLLGNDLVAEAFHLQRSKNDTELFRQFLTGCMCLGKVAVLRDLAFTDEESKILEEFLRETQTSKAENLHFVYLLQKSKYIEAMSYLDELSRNKQNHRTIDLETPNLVLSAYNSTMTPASKQWADVYYGIRNKLKPKDAFTSNPSPLSSQLLKQNANSLTGGIYHSSVIGTDHATVYWDEDIYRQKNRLLDARNAPFVRSPQLDILNELYVKDSVSYPEVYKSVQKRKADDDFVEIGNDIVNGFGNPQKRRKFENQSFASSLNYNLNTSLLTRFKQKTRENDCSSVGKMPRSSISTQNSISKVSFVLNTPIVKSSWSNLREEYDSTDERVCTPHSILKVRHLNDRSETSASNRSQFKEHVMFEMDEKAREMTTDEDKSIRFDLPGSQNSSIESSLSLDKSKQDVMEKEEGEEQKQKKVEGEDVVDELYSKIKAGPQKRKPLRKFQQNLMSTSLNSEEYFSVSSSKDVSKSSDRDFEDDNAMPLWGEIPRDSEKEKVPPSTLPLSYETFNQRYSGPKARKSLSTESKSPEKESYSDQQQNLSPIKCRTRSRSKTPDRCISPSRQSQRLLNKRRASQDREIQHKTSEDSEDVNKKLTFSGPVCRPRKPLNRMVLEANAIKSATENSKGTSGETFICKNSESTVFGEKSGMIFEPLGSSSRIFNNTSSIAEHQSSTVDDSSYKDTTSISFDVSTGNSSVLEKSEETEKETSTETSGAITRITMTTLTTTKAVKFDSNPTFTVDNSKFAEDIVFEESALPKDSDAYQGNVENTETSIVEQQIIREVPIEKSVEVIEEDAIEIIGKHENSEGKPILFVWSDDCSKSCDSLIINEEELSEESEENVKDDDEQEIVSISSGDTTLHVAEDDENSSDHTFDNFPENTDSDMKTESYTGSVGSCESGSEGSQLFCDGFDDEMKSITEMDDEDEDKDNNDSRSREKTPITIQLSESASENEETKKRGSSIEITPKKRMMNCLIGGEESLDYEDADRQNKSKLQGQCDEDPTVKKPQSSMLNNPEPLYADIDTESKSAQDPEEAGTNVKNDIVFKRQTVNKESGDPKKEIQIQGEDNQILNFLTGEEESMENLCYVVHLKYNDENEQVNTPSTSYGCEKDVENELEVEREEEVEMESNQEALDLSISSQYEITNASSNHQTDNSVLIAEEQESPESPSNEFEKNEKESLRNVSPSNQVKEPSPISTCVKTKEAKFSKDSNEMSAPIVHTQESPESPPNEFEKNEKQPLRNVSPSNQVKEPSLISTCVKTKEAEFTKDSNETLDTNKNNQNSPRKEESASEKIENISEVYTEIPKKRVSRSRRARSESIDKEKISLEFKGSPIPSRVKRANSISSETPPTTPNRTITRRQSALLNPIDENSILESPSVSGLPSTPNRVITRRQSALLNRMEEDSIPHSPLTRSASLKKLDTGYSEMEQTPKRRSRQSSADIDGYPTTPRTMTIRTGSKNNIENNEQAEIFEKIKQKMKEKGGRKRIRDHSDSDETIDEEAVEVVKKVKSKENISAESGTPKKLPPKLRKKEICMEVNSENVVSKEIEKISENSEVSDKKKAGTSEKKKSTEPQQVNRGKSRPSTSAMPENTEKKLIKDKNEMTIEEKDSVENVEERSEKNEKKLKVVRKEVPLEEPINKKAQSKIRAPTPKPTLFEENEEKSPIGIENNKKKEETEDYSTSRRLTRGQKAVIAKSASIMPSQIDSSTIKRRRSSKSGNSPESDTESMSSAQSKKSIKSSVSGSRRSKRLISKAGNDEMETSSVGSNTSSQAPNTPSKRGRGRPKNLQTINEEDKSTDHGEEKKGYESDQQSTPSRRTKKIKK